MGIRMSGINSGLDTDSIVQALMSAQNYKKTKIENKQTKLEWKQEAWKDLNTKLYDFYKTSLSKLKTQGTYKTKAATSSDTSKVTATAGSSATEGSYRVKIKSLASAQYVTSGKVGYTTNDKGEKTSVTSKTKLMNILDDNSGTTSFQKDMQIQFKTGKGGYSTLIVDENTTVNDFLSAAKNAGLNATFDEKQQRFFISSTDSGENQNFSVTTVQLSQGQMDALDNLKKTVGYDYLSNTDKAAVSKIFDQLQGNEVTADSVQSVLDNYAKKAAKTAANNYYKKVFTGRERAGLFGSDGELLSEPAARQALINAGAEADKVNAMSSDELKNQVNSLIDKTVAEKLATDAVKAEIENVAQNGTSSAMSLTSSEVSGAPEVIQFDESNRNSVIDSQTTAFVTEFTTAGNFGSASNALSVLGMNDFDGTQAIKEGDTGYNGMVLVKASDAAVEFNGATLTSSTSTLEINGLKLNILSETVNDEVTISVTKDTSAVYDTIKDFISEYNSILSELNTKYNAASSRGYEPLTDEQKEAMTDDEVEKWETKIKDSLLRRDDTVSSLISSFRTNMMGSIAYNGKNYSLASLGITTSTDYKEGGLLHIKGDEDDSDYSDEENLLEKMLTDDPDAVMNIFSGLTNNLYNDLQKKMGTSTLSSALTFYNDKEMNKQWSQYRDEINDWTIKLNAMEDRYYSQFTAMEKALASLNSQQSALAGLLG